MSQRVKDTFVIRGPNHKDDDIDQAGTAPALASVERDESDGLSTRDTHESRYSFAT